ncbi:MAG: hypothetical protein RL660_2838, partial [Bacteroidota bacterium]
MRGFLQTLQIILFLTIASFAAKGQNMVTAFASNDTICPGGSVTLTFTANFTPIFQYWTGTGISPSSTNASETVVLNTPGVYTYTIYAKDIDDNSATNTISIYVISDSTTITENICSGSTYAFNGQNLSASGTYYDTLINTLGCDSIVTLNLTVNNLPAMPSVVASASTICQGDTALLKLQSTAPYCLWSPDPTYGDFVANVTLGSINNTTTYPSAGGYTLFSPSPTTTTTLTATSTYTISMKAGTFFNNCIAAWIDFDKDGVFASSEKIAQSGYLPPNGIYTVTFTVPSGAINGNTRMRVAEEYGNLNVSPCTNLYNPPSGLGEVEDYTVTMAGGVTPITFAWTPSTSITTPSADSTYAFPTANTTYTVTGTDLNGCTNTATVNITVNMPSGSTMADTICSGNLYAFGGQSITATGTYYDTLVNAVGCDSIITLNLYAKPISNYTYADTICAGTPYTFNGQSLTTTGAYYDTLVNAVGCDSFITLNLTVNSLPAMPSVWASASTICQGDSTLLKAQPQTGAVSYCLLSPYAQDGDYVANVTLGSINNTTTYPASGGYTLFAPTATTSTTLTASNTYTISLEVGTIPSDNYIAAWIDFNKNGVFEPSEKIAQSGGLGANGIYTVAFTVPSGAINGNTRMRVVDEYFFPNISPCVTFYGVGEVEDYIVTITGGVSPITFTWTPSTSVTTPGADSTFAFPTSNTTYTVTGTDLNGCTNTATVSVIVRELPNITATASSNTLCQGASINLMATSSTQGFVAPFDPTNGTFETFGSFTTGGFNTSNVPNSISMTSSNNLSFATGINYWVLDTITQAGTITFDWNYATTDALNLDYAVYTINGGLPNTLSSFSTSGANTQSGTQTISLNAGDQIKLGIYTDDNSGGPCTVVISNFSFTPTMPLTYVWSGNDLTNTSNDTATAILNTAGLQTFTVTATDINACTNTAVVDVLVNTSSNYTYADTICAGTPYTFNGQSLTASGVYYDTVVNAGGCDSFVTLNLFVGPVPIIATTVSNDSVCQGSAVALMASNTNSYADTGFVGPFAPSSLTLTLGDTLSVGGYQFLNNELVMYPSFATTYPIVTMTITDYLSTDTFTEAGTVTFLWNWANNSGIDPAFVNVRYRVNNGPSNLFAGFTFSQTCCQNGYQAITVNAGDVIIFELHTAYNEEYTALMYLKNVSFTPTTAPIVNYVWTGSALSNANSDSAIAVLNLSGNQTYTVTGTDVYGCSGTATATVYAKPFSSLLAAATSSQTQTQADGTQITYTNNDCDVIAGVADAVSGNLLGNTISTVTIDATAQTHNSQPYCRRHYDITPANQGAAVVTLYATQADFDDYNATALANGWPPMPVDALDTNGFIPNVRVTQVHGTGGLGTGVSELITPTSVVWDAALTAWQITFPVDSFSGFYIHTGAAAPLAINLLNFSGEVKDASDVLYWTTSSEINSDYFELQYSTDAKNFSTIASIDTKAPNGNSATALDYTYTNAYIVAGYNYYKLKSVDKSGKAQYSNTIKLHHQAIDAAVSVVPNPFTNNINVVVDATADDNVSISIHDASGRIVYTSKAAVKAGKNELSITTSDWASGIYFVNVKQGQYSVNTIKVT